MIKRFNLHLTMFRVTVSPRGSSILCFDARTSATTSHLVPRFSSAVILKLACLARRSIAFSRNFSTLLQVETSIYSIKAHITSNLFVRGQTLSCFVSLDLLHSFVGVKMGGRRGILPTVTICYLLMDKRKNAKNFSLGTKLFLFCPRDMQNNYVT